MAGAFSRDDNADRVAPGEIEALIAMMSKLPGLGPRSARRAVLHLVRRKEQALAPLAQAMAEVALRAEACEICGNIDTEPTCRICRDPSRDATRICVVEDVGDLWALERAAVFRGRYHVLGGVLSALEGVGPDQLRIPDLVARASDEAVSEVVVALSSTVDGQTTAHVIADALETAGVSVTTLARGVPLGGELGYLDEGTLEAAFGARKAL